MDLLREYFPSMTPRQDAHFLQLGDVYREWNQQINVISRKDIDQLYERHVLHSLAIYKFLAFQPGSQILDIGTGGGFPGIPLAIMQPEVQFVLVDSIGKKIKVVQGVVDALGLRNVSARHERAEKVNGKFDFVVSRAVAPLSELIYWCRPKISGNDRNALPNGLICLKGGDLREEIKPIPDPVEIHPLSEYFSGEFFQEKKLIYVSL
ncbi:MAG: 16S rRNA (guanine(527)-N(7))-methyltransferase RsmG [Flavobacteriales bacterium]